MSQTSLLTETHRHLIQYIMKKGYCSEQELNIKVQEFRSLHYETESKNFQNFVLPNFSLKIGDSNLSDYVTTINEELKSYHFYIQKVKFRIDRVVYYGFINQLGDEISKLGSMYEINELQFLEKILLKITEHDELNTDMSLTDAYNLVPKKMGLKFAERVVKMFVKNGWLYYNNASKKLWFGVRSCLELPKYVEKHEE